MQARTFFFQNEQTTKGHELLQLKNDYKELRGLLEVRESELDDLKKASDEKDDEIARLKEQIKAISLQISSSTNANTTSDRGDIKEHQIDKLKDEIRELRQELSEVSMSEYEGLEAGRMQRKKKIEDAADDISANEDKHSCVEVEKLTKELETRKKEFEKERLIWAQEKEKVLRYQRQLQMNYVQMYRRTRALEDEVESLTIELELDKTGHKKQLSTSDLTQTIEL